MAEALERAMAVWNLTEGNGLICVFTGVLIRGRGEQKQLGKALSDCLLAMRRS